MSRTGRREPGEQYRTGTVPRLRMELRGGLFGLCSLKFFDASWGVFRLLIGLLLCHSNSSPY